MVWYMALLCMAYNRLCSFDTFSEEQFILLWSLRQIRIMPSICSFVVNENIHHVTESRWKRANLWPWASCLARPAVCVSSSLWLKVNRRINPVFILSCVIVTVVILSALARNAAQVLFGCLENITHTSPAEARKPLLIMRLWDVIFQSV